MYTSQLPLNVSSLKSSLQYDKHQLDPVALDSTNLILPPKTPSNSDSRDELLPLSVNTVSEDPKDTPSFLDSSENEDNNNEDDNNRDYHNNEKMEFFNDDDLQNTNSWLLRIDLEFLYVPARDPISDKQPTSEELEDNFGLHDQDEEE